MPKRIVIRTKEEEEKPNEAEEYVPIIAPAQEVPVEESVRVREKQTLKEIEVASENGLKKGNDAYADLLGRLDLVRRKDEEFQKTLKEQDVSLTAVKRILSRLNDVRANVVKDSTPLKDSLVAIKEKLEEAFSLIEENLYMASIDLNTIELEEREKQELEADKQLLRQKLFETKSKLRDVEAKIKDLEEMPRKIVSTTTSVSISTSIYEELLKKHPEDVLQRNIANIADAEKIPREYATIIVWKKLQGAFRTGP